MVNDSLEVDIEQTDTFQLSVYKYTNLTARNHTTNKGLRGDIQAVKIR